MKRQVRIGPVQESISCEVLADSLKRICNFLKIERVPSYRAVILSFESEKEAIEAVEKLQGFRIQGRQMSVDLVYQVAQKLDLFAHGFKKTS